MIIFKTVLTDKQIEDYKRPEGTKNYDCGGGVNCAFCTLKMLGVYNPELEETSKTCGPRFRAGNMVKPAEYLGAVKRVIADMTDEQHEFVFDQEIGQPSVSLAKVAEYLGSQEACYFIYGRVGSGTHAVVLRKNLGGQVELIDPQRGSDDIGKEYGFTADRAAELRIELTPQYYRVRGIPAIEEVMIEQSVLFKYWGSKKELLDDIAHFTVACVMVDSVVGLKMLIDDHKDTSKMMDVEEMVVPNPNPNPQMDVETESEMEMEGGGNGTSVSVTPARPQGKTVYVKGVLNPRDLHALFSEGETTDTEAETVELTEYDKLVHEISDLIAYPPNEKGESRPKFFILTPVDVEEEEEEQLGGVKPEEQELLRKKLQRNKDGWTEYTDPSTRSDIKKLIEKVEKQKKDFVNTTFDLLKTDKSAVFANRLRASWEKPSAGGQCASVVKLTDKGPKSDRNCWLCGNPVELFKTSANDFKWKDFVLKMCEGDPNTRDCEHILPAPLMMFLGVMYTKAQADKNAYDDAKTKELMRELYDTSCHQCNAIKKETLYIVGKSGEFQPDSVNILIDCIRFIMSISKTGILKLETRPEKSQKILKETCSDGSRGLTTGTEGVPLAEQFTLTSIVTVTKQTDSAYVKKYPNLIRAFLGIGKTDTLTSINDDARDSLINIKDVIEKTEAGLKKFVEEDKSKLLLEDVQEYKEGGEEYVSITEAPQSAISEASTQNIADRARDIIERGELAHIQRNQAAVWILSRYGQIYNRMLDICELLNQPEITTKWKERYDLLKTHSVVPPEGDQALPPRPNRSRRPSQPFPEAVEVLPYTTTSEDRAQKRGRDDDDDDDDGSRLAKRQRIGGEQHLDISVHRGGRRVIDVEI